MKIVSTVIFITFFFCLAFTIIWDLAPYALTPDLLLQKVTGVISEDKENIVKNIFTDWVVPTLKKIGINFANLYEKMSNVIENIAVKFFEAIVDFKEAFAKWFEKIVQGLNDIVKFFRNLFS